MKAKHTARVYDKNGKPEVLPYRVIRTRSNHPWRYSANHYHFPVTVIKKGEQ